MAYKIAVVPGDGIGQEITQEAVRVLRAVDAKFALGLTYETRDAGGTAYDKYGTPLPEDTLAVCRESDGVLFGAVAALVSLVSGGSGSYYRRQRRDWR